MEVVTQIDNFNKTYCVGEFITGNVIITSREKYTDMESLNISLRVRKSFHLE